MPEFKAYLLSNSVRTNIVQNETTIGRLTSNIISLADPTVSKNHASIYQSQDSRFYLVDHNTVNGTFLNGTKLEPNKKHSIKHKDSIQFGKCMIFLIQILTFLTFIKATLNPKKKEKSISKIIALN